MDFSRDYCTETIGTREVFFVYDKNIDRYNFYITIFFKIHTNFQNILLAPFKKDVI
jgi:hypothetical protein